MGKLRIQILFLTLSLIGVLAAQRYVDRLAEHIAAVNDAQP